MDVCGPVSAGAADSRPESAWARRIRYSILAKATVCRAIKNDHEGARVGARVPV